MESEGTPGGIHAAIVKIMTEVGAVKKDRVNTNQKYKFRGIADLYKACQPVMAANGVHVVPHQILDQQIKERASAGGGLLTHIWQRILFRFYHTDGSWVPCETVGEAMDSGDKAANKCMSSAVKYALIVTFAIPEEDPTMDTENDSPEPLATPVRIPTPPALAAVEVAAGKKMMDDAAVEINDAKKRAAVERAKQPGTCDVDSPAGEVPVFLFRGGAWAFVGGFAPVITKEHQQRVKILQKELKIPEATWTEKLVGYYGKTSSKQLSDQEGVDLAARLEALKKALAG